MRVYELAKELNLKSQDLIQKLRELGHSVTNHFSDLDEGTVRRLRTIFSHVKEERSRIEENRIGSTRSVVVPLFPLQRDKGFSTSNPTSNPPRKIYTRVVSNCEQTHWVSIKLSCFNLSQNLPGVQELCFDSIKHLNQLAELAFPEPWTFGKTSSKNRNKPILEHYLRYTLIRLVEEKKVAFSADSRLVVFNTGLVHIEDEPIFTLFDRVSSEPPGCLYLKEFLTANSERLKKNFEELPFPPEYLRNPSEVIYDTRLGEPELDLDHIIGERIYRFPPYFLKENGLIDFDFKDTKAMSKDEKDKYRAGLIRAIDPCLRQRIEEHLINIVKLCIKRISSDPKIVIPQYNPKLKKIQLLLPLCLMQDDVTDLALVVAKKESGGYIAPTVLPLAWAYMNARVICRPKSEWLTPENISEEEDEFEEDEI
jgi:hypothetical protein